MITAFAHEYTYQDSEYRIRAMNSKHAQCTCYTFGRSVLYIAPNCMQVCLSIVLSTSVIVLLRQC